MSTTTQQTVKGLDIGTSRIVLATLNGEDVDFNPQLNAFVGIPYSKMTEQMLSRERILHQVEGPHIYVYGNRADEFAKSSMATRAGHAGRPAQPDEPKNVQMIELLLGRLCGKSVERREAVLSVPCAPVDRGLRPDLPCALGADHLREARLSGEGDQRGWPWSTPS